MKKTGRLKQLLALILAGALTVGSVGTPVFGADFGDTVVESAVEDEPAAGEEKGFDADAFEDGTFEEEIENLAEEAGEVSDGTAVVEEPEENGDAGIGDSQDDTTTEEGTGAFDGNREAYTVTLDANGGYFANEWDDIQGVTVESTEVLNKIIPIGGSVETVPVRDQENAVVTFLGWSLERDGECVGTEYVPTENCTLYAVWQIEESAVEDMSEDVSEGVVPAADTGLQKESAEDTTADEEYLPETDVAEDEPTGEEYEPEADTNQDEFVEEANDPEADTAQDDSIVPEEMDAAQDEDTVSETGSSQDTDDNVSGTDAVEEDAAQENHETVEEAEAAQEPGNTKMAKEPEEGAIPAKTIKPETGTTDQQNATLMKETTHTLIDSEDVEEEIIGEDAAMGVVESGTYGKNVTWKLDDEGTLTISGTGDMLYCYDTSQCTFKNYTIKKVIIEDGVTSIGGAAFCDCSSLSSVTIPNSVTSIGWAAFRSCSSLKNVTIPNSVTSIGNGVFASCTSLKSVTIPNSVTSIGQYVFRNCTSLSSVTIPNSVTSISYYTFQNCTSLRNVTIPESVTYIGDHAFQNCTSLSSVTIPESVTYLGRYSFEGTKNVSYAVADGVEILDVGYVLSGVENLYIPKSVKYIGESEISSNSSTQIKGSDEITGKNIYFAGNINEWKRIKCTVDWGFDDRNVWHATQEFFYTRVPSGILHVGELLGNSITAKNITVNALNTQQNKNINATATAGTVKYSSNNSNITVNSAGKITIKKNYAGKATITMTASAQYYKTAKKTVTVTVKKATPTITASNKTRTASAKKQTFKIGAKTTGGKLSYKSDTKGISVNSSGTVTVSAKFVGKGTITITSAPSNAFYKATKKITVTVKKQAPTITAKNMTQYVAKNTKTYDLGATCSISGALKYKSNNSNIIVNSAGKITVKKNYEGKATITISLPANAIRKAASKTVMVSVVKRNNPITASNITTYYASGKKVLDIGASSKGNTKLTYSSDNSHIKVSSTGDITISSGYVGKATITIKTSGNRYYKASSKKITVTVKDSGSGSGSGSGGSSGGGSSTARECQQCDGTGVCPICDGKGLNTSGSRDNWTKCVSCKGDGYCHYCGGDGIKDN